MKNILGKTENLSLYNKEGKIVYKFIAHPCGGISYEYTYNVNGDELTFKNSNGFSSEYTYDLGGDQLTYKDSNGVSDGYNIPEYTMEELVEKLGNFKIKK